MSTLNNLQWINRSHLNDLLLADRFTASFLYGSKPDANISNVLLNPGNIADILQVNVTNVALPNIDMGVDENLLRKWTQKKRTENELKTVFIENKSMSIKNYFWNWIELSASLKDMSGDVVVQYYWNDVAIDIQVEIFNLNKKTTHTEIYKHCLPVSVNAIELDITKEASDLPQTEITWKYKYHEMR